VRDARDVMMMPGVRSDRCCWLTDEDPVDGVLGMLVDVCHPLLNVFERLLVSHVVDQENAHCISVVEACDGPEPLLSSGVQELQFYILLVDLDPSNLEINADCRRTVYFCA
jgi:hypothetical protein